jgi:DNA-binding NarL/FixJ family response regulator
MCNFDHLGPRSKQVAELLLLGCTNADIAKSAGMRRRTVKAHMARLFRHYGIEGGIKRVKLAVALYRERHDDL